MILKAACFFILLFLPVYLSAQTIVNGSINRNTRWFGQVYIDGDVTVQKGATLFIEPGSRLVFRANSDKTKSGKDPNRAELTVLGALIANGEAGDGQIVFTTEASSPQPGSWYGIILKNRAAPSVLKNCIVEFAYKGISCYGSSPEISACEARYNQYAGISAEVLSAAAIRGCSLVNNAFAGLLCELGATPLVEKTLISHNTNGVLIFDRSRPDLGRYAAKEGESAGENRIFNNIETDIYNRSTYDVYAQNNNWNSNNLPEIQNRIKDREINPSYGKVLFEPLYGRRPPILSRQFTAGENAAELSPPLVAGAAAVTEAAGSNGNPAASLQQSPGASRDTTAQDSLIQNQLEATSVVTPETLIVYREIFVEKPPEEETPIIAEPVLERQLDSGARHYEYLPTPVYPEIYKRTGYEGRVIMEVIVGREGQVESYKILRTNGEYFSRSAEDAIKKTRYKPETFQGHPVKFKVFESFIFKLGE